MRLDLSINICFVSPADANHPARDIEVVWFGPKLLDSNEEEQGPAYGNVAFNMPAHWIELLITKKGFKCYWMENFVWPRNIAVRCSLLTEPNSLIGQKMQVSSHSEDACIEGIFPSDVDRWSLVDPLGTFCTEEIYGRSTLTVSSTRLGIYDRCVGGSTLNVY